MTKTEASAKNWLSRVEPDVALATLKLKPFAQAFLERKMAASSDAWRTSRFIIDAVVKQLTHAPETFRGTCSKPSTAEST